MSACCSGSSWITKEYVRDATRRKKQLVKLTKLGLLLLVGLARLDALLSLLGLGDGLLDGDEPAITLSQGLSLEGVLVAVDLECESNGAVPDKVGGVGLRSVS
jgi:hypothetical protein